MWLKQIGAPFILSHKEQSLRYRLMNNELFGETEQFQHLFLIRYFSFITYEIKPQNGQRHPLLQKAECDRKKCRKCGLHVLCGDIIYALTIHSNNTDMQSIYGQSTAPLVPSFNRRRWLKWDLWEDTEQIQTTAVGGIVYRLHLEGLTIWKLIVRQSLVGPHYTNAARWISNRTSKFCLYLAYWTKMIFHWSLIASWRLSGTWSVMYSRMIQLKPCGDV